jgi:hypothetical protein
MFDVNIILSSFLLVFVAELGDKTQIATFSLSATSGKPIKIFFASAAALVLSTVLAAAAGRITSHLIPGFTGYIAGGLFIIFGIVMLVSKEVILIEDSFARLLALEKAGSNAASARIKETEEIGTAVQQEESHIELLQYLLQERRFFEDDINEEPKLQELYDKISGYSVDFSSLSREEVLDKLIELENLGIEFYTFLFEHLKRDEHQETNLQKELQTIIEDERAHIRLYSRLKQRENR